MLLKEKELEYFKSAKKYFNSSPSEYSKSLKELNKITLLIRNITIIHMKTLCLLMLSKYEDIIEFYYLNRNHLELLLRQKNSDSSNDDNNNDIENEKEEIKKIISIAFFNLGMKKKAKILCPDIKDEYIIEKSEFEIIQSKEDVIDNRKIKINSNRINESILLRNIKNNLDKSIESKKGDESNKVSSNLNSSRELIPKINEFVDNLFKSAIETNKMRNPKQEIKEESVKEEEDSKNNKEINDLNSGDFIEQNESLLSNGSNVSNINKKLKLEINLNNINNIKKEDGQLMTMEEKIKANLEENNDKSKDEKNNDDKSNDDKSIDNKGNESIDDKSNDDKNNDKKSDDKNNNKVNKNENNDDKKSDSKNSDNKTINKDNKDENKEDQNNEKKESNDKNNKKKNNDDNNNTNNENNINIKSNRSEKYNNQKEIKGLLNKQKIPYMRKLTKEEVVRKRLEGVKTKEKTNIKKEEKIKNTIEEKNEIIEENDNIEKEKNKEQEEKKEINIENKENNVLKDNRETKENIENKKEKENEENIINDLKDNNDKIETQNKEEKNDNNKNSNNNNYIKKSYTHDKKMTFINKELKRIYPKPDDNEKNSIRKDNINDKNKRISIGNIKTCKTNSFKNPFEFTLNPEEGGSFKQISSNSSLNENNEKEGNKNNNINENIKINDKKDEINKDSKNEQSVNIDQNRALLRVEIDGEQIDLIQNENPSRKNSKYANYINIDYNEFSNKKRKKMIDKFRNSAVKGLNIINKDELPKSTKINSYVLRGIKSSNPFNMNDAQSFSSMTNKTPSNIKKTCFYKTSYFLDKFDSK